MPTEKFSEALRECYPSKAADRIVRILGLLKGYKDEDGNMVYGPLCLMGSEAETALHLQHIEAVHSLCFLFVLKF